MLESTSLVPRKRPFYPESTKDGIGPFVSLETSVASDSSSLGTPPRSGPLMVKTKTFPGIEWDESETSGSSVTGVGRP